MDIDITDMTANEIQQLLSNYPRGRLEVKHDRIFWDSVDPTPAPRPMEAAPQHYPPHYPQHYPPQQPPRQQNQGNKVAQSFERMADTLGSMVC